MLSFVVKNIDFKDYYFYVIDQSSALLNILGNIAINMSNYVSYYLVFYSF